MSKLKKNTKVKLILEGNIEDIRGHMDTTEKVMNYSVARAYVTITDGLTIRGDEISIHCNSIKIKKIKEKR